MKYLVQECQNLTACSTQVMRGPLNRVLSETLFDTEEAALNHYEKRKLALRFAGLAGEYCAIRNVEDNYIVRTDDELLAEYEKECENSLPYDEPYYEDEY